MRQAAIDRENISPEDKAKLVSLFYVAAAVSTIIGKCVR
jgi:hypothetical protein